MILAFAAGLVFALGLGLAGMTSPAKVTAFLDVANRGWDPSLALVMASAIGVFLPLYLRARRLSRPILGGRFAVPSEDPIDARLIGGAAVFGAGWGLSGLCPGPAIVSLAAGGGTLFFVAGMLGAIAFYEVVVRRARPAVACGEASAAPEGAPESL